MQIDRTKIIIICASVIALSGLVAGPANAQQQKAVGMKHLKAWPDEPAKEEGADKPSADSAENNSSQSKSGMTLPEYHPLDIEDALVQPDDLEVWSHLDEVALANTDSEIKNLIYVIESDRGAVPPQGLFLAAKSLADRHLMEQAALYYLVGQLRLSFDIARWPPYQNKQDLERKSIDAKKTEDQKSPESDKEPRIEDPHQGIKNLAESLGQPIIAWMMKNPDRMKQVLHQAMIWDASAPYLYLPSDRLGEPVPFDKWKKLLPKVRETYRDHILTLVATMKKAKGQ